MCFLYILKSYLKVKSQWEGLLRLYQHYHAWLVCLSEHTHGDRRPMLLVEQSLIDSECAVCTQQYISSSEWVKKT